MSENPQTPPSTPPSAPTSPLDPPPAPAAKAAPAHEHGHSATLTCTIDGQAVTVPHGTTIFDAARLNGIPIPTLCHQQNQTPVAVCRICVVDCGERAYQAACIRECEPDMKIQTASPGVVAARENPLRTPARRSSSAVHPPAKQRRLRTRNAGGEIRARRRSWRLPRPRPDTLSQALCARAQRGRFFALHPR